MMENINGQRLPEFGHFSRIRALLSATIIEAQAGAKDERTHDGGCEQTTDEFDKIERDLHDVLMRIS